MPNNACKKKCHNSGRRHFFGKSNAKTPRPRGPLHHSNINPSTQHQFIDATSPWTKCHSLPPKDKENYSCKIQKLKEKKEKCKFKKFLAKVSKVTSIWRSLPNQPQKMDSDVWTTNQSSTTVAKSSSTLASAKKERNTNSEVSSRSFFNAVKSICRRDIIRRRQIDVDKTSHVITKR